MKVGEQQKTLDGFELTPPGVNQMMVPRTTWPLVLFDVALHMSDSSGIVGMYM